MSYVLNNPSIFANYNNSFIKERIKSGLLFWCNIQNRDGSFNEYYQNDRSFCPSAFTTYAAAKTFFDCKSIFNDEEKHFIKNTLIKSSVWLKNHKYPAVQNQMIASMNALYFCSKVLKDPNLIENYKSRKKEVLQKQDEEGWFLEYNGADIGYSFIALDLFATFLSNNEDEEIINAALKLIKFIVRFIHPDGSIGGIYGSRCTAHVMPFGISFFSKYHNPETMYLSAWYKDHSEMGTIIDPLQIDDKYFSYFYFNSYMQNSALNQLYVDKNIKNTMKFDPIEVFNNAGLIRYQKSNTLGFLNWKKNGVCAIYHGRKLIYSDTGYLFKLSSGISGATQFLDDNAEVVLNEKETCFEIKIKGISGEVDYDLPLVKWIIFFKIFCKTILRFDSISYWFNNYIKTLRVKNKKPVLVQLKRIFKFSYNKIIIEDKTS